MRRVPVSIHVSLFYHRLRYRKFIAHRTRFNALFKAFIAIQTTDDFKWNDKVGRECRMRRITKARRFNSRIAQAVISRVSCGVSLVAPDQEIMPTLHVFMNCVLTKHFIQVRRDVLTRIFSTRTRRLNITQVSLSNSLQIQSNRF